MNSSTQSESDIKSALAFIQSAIFFDNISKQEFRDAQFMKVVVGDYGKLLPGIDEIKDELEGTGISAYEWSENPRIRGKIKEMASAEYNAGGSEKAITVIEKMTDTELKKWLTGAVINDMGLGVKIIINGGK